MKHFKRMIAMAALSGCCAAQADGGGGGGDANARSSASDPVIVAAQAAIDQKDWEAAQATLLKALAANGKNADYHNLYAYSMRKSANPNMEVVFSHYGEALRIDPKHLGAHEYLGEAYLQVGNLPKAKEQLAALNKLCFLGCEQYRDLKGAIAKYEVSQPG
jgi:tetratricopeptide (TPR) repeat protein